MVGRLTDHDQLLARAGGWILGGNSARVIPWHPPVPPPEQRDKARYEKCPHDGGIEQDADSHSRGEHLYLHIRASRQGLSLIHIYETPATEPNFATDTRYRRWTSRTAVSM